MKSPFFQLLGLNFFFFTLLALPQGIAVLGLDNTGDDSVAPHDRDGNSNPAPSEQDIPTNPHEYSAAVRQDISPDGLTFKNPTTILKGGKGGGGVKGVTRHRPFIKILQKWRLEGQVRPFVLQQGRQVEEQLQSRV